MLTEIGLKEIEAKIYLKLLEEDSILASNLARKLKLHRTSVYDTLDKLTNKGLASYFIKSGKKYFRATNPDRLLEIEEEKEMNLREFVTSLKNLKKPQQKEPLFEIYVGREGIKTIWEDILRGLKKGDEFLALATGKAPKILPYYMPQFHKRRIKAGIKLRIIYGDTKEEKERGDELSKMRGILVKYIPRQFTNPAATLIYDNKVAIILWSEDNLVASLAQSEEISASFRNYFETLWKIAKVK